MWLAKLERMMKELPEEYLEPEPIDPEDAALIPAGSEPISQLTEEEKRLNGVYRQIENLIILEEEAHEELHRQSHVTISPDVCQDHKMHMFLLEEEMVLVLSILMRSMEERLGFGSDYTIDGDDIYAIPSSLSDDTGPGPVPKFNPFPFKSVH